MWKVFYPLIPDLKKFIRFQRNPNEKVDKMEKMLYIYIPWILFTSQMGPVLQSNSHVPKTD